MMKKVIAMVMMVVIAMMAMVPMTASAFNSTEAQSIFWVLEDGLDEGTLKVSSRNFKKLEKMLVDECDDDMYMVTSVSNTAYGPYRMHAIVMIGYEVGDNFVYRSFTMDAVNDEADIVLINDVCTSWRVVKTSVLDGYDWTY